MDDDEYYNSGSPPPLWFHALAIVLAIAVPGLMYLATRS